MRPPKVSTIPERTGKSYKKSQFFRTLMRIFVNKPKRYKICACPRQKCHTIPTTSQYSSCLRRESTTIKHFIIQL